MIGSGMRGWRSLLVFAGLWALFFAFFWDKVGVASEDLAGQILVSKGLAAGELLYRDITWVYGPLTPYVNAVLLRASGNAHVLLVHAFVLVVLAVWLWSLLGAEWFGAGGGFLAGLFMLVIWGTSNFANVPYSFASAWATALGVAAMLAAFRALRRPSPGLAALAGLLTGLAGICKLNTGAGLFLGILAAFVLHRRQGARDPGLRTLSWPSIAACAAAAAAPVVLGYLPFALFLEPTRLLGSLFPVMEVEAMGLWQKEVAPGYPAIGGQLLTIAALDRRIHSAVQLLSFAPGVWMYLGAVAGSVVQVVRAVRGREVPARMLLLSTLLALSPVYAFILGHLLAIAVLPMFWWAAFIGDERWSRLVASRWRLPAIILCATMLAGAAGFRMVRLGSAPRTDWIWDLEDLPPDMERLQDLAARHTSGSKPLLCVGPCEMVYHVAGQLPPNSGYYWLPGFLPADELARLEAETSAGRYGMVLVRERCNDGYRTRSFRQGFFRRLEDRYAESETVGPIRVYLPK